MDAVSGMGIAVYRGYLRPAGAGYLAAGSGLLVGAMMTTQEAPGHMLAAATLVALLAAGVVLRRVWLGATGAVGQPPRPRLSRPTCRL